MLYYCVYYTEYIIYNSGKERAKKKDNKQKPKAKPKKNQKANISKKIKKEDPVPTPDQPSETKQIDKPEVVEKTQEYQEEDQSIVMVQTSDIMTPSKSLSNLSDAAADEAVIEQEIEQTCDDNQEEVEEEEENQEDEKKDDDNDDEMVDEDEEEEEEKADQEEEIDNDDDDNASNNDILNESQSMRHKVDALIHAMNRMRDTLEEQKNTQQQIVALLQNCNLRQANSPNQQHTHSN